MTSKNALRPVAIIGGTRIPFVRSFQHYRTLTNQKIMTDTLQALVEKYQLHQKTLGDVSLGSIMLNSKDWNFSRECVLGTTLHARTPGYTIQRACGLGLEAINQIALKIAAGQINSGIGGGSDTNSDLPIMGKRDLGQFIVNLKEAKTTKDQLQALITFRPSFMIPDFPQVQEPRTGLSMGEHCEKMVKEWGISRSAQDEWAYQSHQKCAASYDSGFQNDLVIPYEKLAKDTILRAETSLEKLAKLKPAFDRSAAGTLTAGNSTPLTDGASCALLMSFEAAQKWGLTPLATFVDAQVAALDFVKGEGLLMAPTLAVGQLLERHELTFSDIDVFEIHEAFAGQVLCTLKAWQNEDYCKKTLGLKETLGAIDEKKINPHGGSLATGHPFAATGARLVAQLAKTLASAKKSDSKKKRGLISICTAGGMGVAALLEA